ncbi:MAG: T9SS type A sorting domain-containing protein, partial [Flavobacteriales bacterium]
CTAPEPVNVTLTLDLGDIVATSAEVSGTFNDYCIGCQPMTATGNNQYMATLQVLPGVHYYRFTINGGTVIESLASGTCTVDFKFGVVRELVVSEAVNVGAVCWESCAPCAVGVQEQAISELNIMPNPATSAFSFQWPYAGTSNYRMADMTGRTVMNGTITGSSKVELNVQQLPAGLYQLAVGNSFHTITQKVLVQH